MNASILFHPQTISKKMSLIRRKISDIASQKQDHLSVAISLDQVLHDMKVERCGCHDHRKNIWDEETYFVRQGP